VALGTPPRETFPDAPDDAVDLKAGFARIWEVLA
jgi:hypothetical protein